MLGVYINAGAVILGTVLGLLFFRTLQKFRHIITDSVGILVTALGIYGVKEMKSAVIVLMSLILGGALGHALDLESRITKLVEGVKGRFQGQNFSEGFVYATTLFVVGPMAVIGSINAGLFKDYSVLILKSVMDGFSAAALTAIYGAGVVLSAASVLAVQGAVVLFSSQLQFLKSPTYLADFSAVGSLLIAMIGMRMLGLKDMKVANYLPALVVSILLVWLSVIIGPVL